MVILCTSNELIEKDFKIQRRNWKTYSAEDLIQNLNQVKWKRNIEGIQEMWNTYEQEILTIVDKIAPLEEVGNTVRRKVSKILNQSLTGEVTSEKNKNTTHNQRMKKKNSKH